jgi:hypothetical protein
MLGSFRYRGDQLELNVFLSINWERMHFDIDSGNQLSLMLDQASTWWSRRPH